MFWRPDFLREGEGGGAPAPAPAPTPEAAPTGDVIGSPPPARPDWLDERDAKFWDADKGVDPQKVYESYRNAQGLIGRRFGDLSPAAKAALAEIVRPDVEATLKDTIKGELTADEEWIKGLLEARLPKAPETYEPPASLAEAKINIDVEHPVWKAAVEIGREHAIPQEALGKLIGLLPQVLEGYLVPPIDQRIQAFGPDFAPRAQAAINIAHSVAARLAGEDGVAKQTNGAYITAMLAELRSPEALKGLELLTKATREKPLPGASAAPPPATVTRESLQKMIADPRYWRDRDPGLIREVEAGFKKLHPSDTL